MKTSIPNSRETPKYLASEQDYFSKNAASDDFYSNLGNSTNFNERYKQDLPFSNFDPNDLEGIESYLLKRQLEIEERMKALDQITEEQAQGKDYPSFQNHINVDPIQNFSSPTHAELYNHMNQQLKSGGYDDRNVSIDQNFSRYRLQSPTSESVSSPDVAFRDSKFQQSAEPSDQKYQPARLQNFHNPAAQKSIETDPKRKYKEELDNQVREKQKQKDLESQASQRRVGSKKNQIGIDQRYQTTDIHQKEDRTNQHDGGLGNFDRKGFPIVSASPYSDALSKPRQSEHSNDLSEEKPAPKKQVQSSRAAQEDEEAKKKLREKQYAEDLRRQIQENQERKKLEKQRLLEEERSEMEKYEREQRTDKNRNQHQKYPKHQNHEQIKPETPKLEDRIQTESSNKLSSPGTENLSYLSSPQLFYQSQSPQIDDLKKYNRKTDESSRLDSRSSNHSSQHQVQYPNMQPPYPFFYPPNWPQGQDARGAQMLPPPYWPYMHPFYYPPPNFANLYPTPTQQDLVQFKAFLQDIQEKSKKEDQRNKERALFKNKLVQNQKENIHSNNQSENLGYARLSNPKLNNLFTDSTGMLQQSSQDLQKSYESQMNKLKQGYFEEQYRNLRQNEEGSQLQNSSLANSERENRFLPRSFQNEIPPKKEGKGYEFQNSPVARISNDNDVSMKSLVAESHISNQSHIQGERSFFKGLEAFEEVQKHADPRNQVFSSMEHEDPSISLSESEGIYSLHRHDFKKNNRFEFAPVIEVGLEETPTQTTNFNQLLGMNAGEKPIPEQIKSSIPDEGKSRHNNSLEASSNIIIIKKDPPTSHEILPFDSHLRKEERKTVSSMKNSNSLLEEIKIDQMSSRKDQEFSYSKSNQQQRNQQTGFESKSVQLSPYHNFMLSRNSRTQDSQRLETTQSDMSRLEMPEREPIEIMMAMESSRYQKEINMADVKSERSMVLPEENNATELRLVEAQSEKSLIIADEEEAHDFKEKSIVRPKETEIMRPGSTNQERSQLSIKSRQKEEEAEYSREISPKQLEALERSHQSILKEELAKSIHSTPKVLIEEAKTKDLLGDSYYHETGHENLEEIIEPSQIEEHQESIKAIVKEDNQTIQAHGTEEINLKNSNSIEIIAKSEEKEVIKSNLRESGPLGSSIKQNETENIQRIQNEISTSEALQTTKNEKEQVSPDVKTSAGLQKRASANLYDIHDPHHEEFKDQVNQKVKDQVPQSTAEGQISSSFGGGFQDNSGNIPKVKGVSEKASLLIKNSHVSLVRHKDPGPNETEDSSAISRLGLLRRIRFQHKVNIANGTHSNLVENPVEVQDSKLQEIPSKEQKTEGMKADVQPLEKEPELNSRIQAQREILQLLNEQQEAIPLTNRSNDPMSCDKTVEMLSIKQGLQELSDTVAYPDDDSLKDTELQNTEVHFSDEQVNSTKGEVQDGIFLQQSDPCQLPLASHQVLPSTSKKELIALQETQAQSNLSQVIDSPSKHDQSHTSSTLGSKSRKIKTLDPFTKPNPATNSMDLKIRHSFLNLRVVKPFSIILNNRGTTMTLDI